MPDLTTLEAVKETGAVRTDAHDPFLARLIASASEFVVQYANREILQATHTEDLDGPGGKILVLRHFPITAVSALSVDGTPYSAYSSSGIGYKFDRHALYLFGGIFTRGRQNVAVTYTAGYATVPPDVEQAVIEAVVMRFKEATKIGEGAQSLAGANVSFKFTDLTDFGKVTMNAYRRVVPV